MEFIIERTDEYKPTEPPFKGAYKYSSKYSIEYLLEELSKLDDEYHNRWYVKNRITDDYKYLWLIEVDSLEELMNISEDADEELVVNYKSDYAMPIIEIYDWYRE